MKVACWNRVDRKLDHKRMKYSHIHPVATYTDCRIRASIEGGSYRIGLGHSQGLEFESDCSSE